MKKLVISSILLLTGMLWAADKLTPLNVKPGLWETTRTYKRVGAPPIPPEMLARLTPEQRARFEERMKANSAAHSTTSTTKSCVTREDLEKTPKFGQDNSECAYTILTSTSTTAKGKISCETEGIKSNGAMEINVVDSEHVKGSSHATMSMNGQSMQMDATFVSKWVGAACGKVK